MLVLNTNDEHFESNFKDLLSRHTQTNSGVSEKVRQIIKQVVLRGDQAVLEFTRNYDGLDVDDISQLEIPKEQINRSLSLISPKLKEALYYAHERIVNFHEKQRQQDWQYSDRDGSTFGQRITAMQRVGVYAPGGKAAYPSSVLMTAIPARLANVEEIILTVPMTNNQINQNVLAAAAIASVDKVYTIGGAQAIAALAYGTQTIGKVDKIVGPGNSYVAEAKRQVFGQVGIDMIAGPSEVLIVSDQQVDPRWVVMDLFAQAEHDEHAQSIHITTDQKHHQQIIETIDQLLPTMKRRAIIKKSLDNHGSLILAQTTSSIVEMINTIAPEHLQLMQQDAKQMMPLIRHAGAIFIGKYSAEVLGDYCAGPNHVLPTCMTARYASPLGVYDFQKRSSVIEFSKKGVRKAAKMAATIAEAEGLNAHQSAALFRLDE